jgi:dTDP-4-dehydrorhamnose reductase
MKVAVIGAGGQLGVDLCGVLAAEGVAVAPLLHRDVEISDSAQVERVLNAHAPDVVINTAAFQQAERCEEHPEKTFAVNAMGPGNLALACKRLNALLVHLSTDYVFDGRQQRPYAESDSPAPVNVYGASRLAGEQLLSGNCERHFIIRTCGLYGFAGKGGTGGNFVESVLERAARHEPIRAVRDQVLSPTFTVDLAEVISRMIRPEIREREGVYGVYHISAEGECSWHEFARKILELEKLDAELQPVSAAEFYGSARRPARAVLSKQKLKRLGLAMPSWEAGLERYLAMRRERVLREERNAPAY